MSLFESLLLFILLVGIAIPAWIASIAIYSKLKSKNYDDPAARYFAYSKVMGNLLHELKDGHTNRAPILIATVRELQNFPEYRDISVLFLEEVSVDGNRKFDRVMEQELKAVEAGFLKVEND